MKILSQWMSFLLLCTLSTAAQGQQLDTTGTAAESVPPAIVERGPHHRVWQRTTTEVLPNGRTIEHKQSYTEMANGLHYQNELGEWTESKAEIELFQNGARAIRGQHQVVFGQNLNSAGVIDLLTPEGKRLKSHILGLAFTDAASGQSVLIAEPKDSIGQLLAPNKVIYPDAFDGPFHANVVFLYSLGGFEQFVILTEAPPSPAEYGLNPDSTFLEVWTEFLDAPDPVKTFSVLRQEADPVKRQAMVAPDFTDEFLNFGTMCMPMGSAFPMEGNELGEIEKDATPTGKSWLKIDGRTFLVEQVQYPAVKKQLDRLPQAAAARPRSKANAMMAANRGIRRPFPAGPKQMAALERKPLQMAALNLPNKGFVLDYTLQSPVTNFTFQGDTTYWVSNKTVSFYGTSVIEGGAVIKFSAHPNVNRLQFLGPIECRTAPWHPAFLVGRDDNTVGEVVFGSTGSPGTNRYAGIAIQPGATSTNTVLHNLRFRNAVRAFWNAPSSSTFELRHSHIGNVDYAFDIAGAPVTGHNLLIYDALNAVKGSANSYVFEQTTFHRIGTFSVLTNTAPLLTNCLLISVTNGLSFVSGSGNASNLVDTGIFQTVAGGARYLVNGSTNRNAGTASINSTLLAELKRMTTEPPQTLFNTNFSVNTILSPIVAGDTASGDLPDRGYHYPILDFIAGGATVASNVKLVATNGVIVGIDYAPANWGFILSNASFISQGGPLTNNRIVRAHTVQEALTTNPPSRAIFYDSPSGASQLSTLRFRFTELVQLQGDGYLLYTGTKLADLELTHSSLYNASLVVDTSGAGSLLCGLTNTLFDGGGVQFGIWEGSAGTTVHVHNNLFRRTSTHFIEGSTNWTVHNNLFDSVSNNVSDNGYPVDNFRNAYFQSTNSNLSGGVSNVFFADLVYEVGPLGRYYLTNTSLLINTGSVSAANVGLFHFTSTTNQVKETNSMVDIGLHYVALNAQGQPIDSDSDGVPDYAEDLNGNGVTDSGETCFHDPILTIASTLTYIKGSPPKLLDTNATVFDAHSPNFDGGKLIVAVVINVDAADRLAIRTQGTNAAQIGVSGTNVTYSSTNIGSFTGGSGANALVVSFNANATPAAVQALVRSLTFQIASNNPAEVAHTLKFILTDGDGGTNAPTYQTVNVVCPDALDVMLLFDVSTSMIRECTNGICITNLNRFLVGKAAASNFVSMLDLAVDRVGLVTFAGPLNEELRVVLTNNGALVQSTIYGQNVQTGTILDAPINLARTNYTGSGSNTLRLMVILSDGEVYGFENTNATIAAATAAQNDGIRILTVAFYTGEPDYTNSNGGGTNLLRQIASSPYDYYFSPSFSEIQSTFNTAIRGLCRGEPPIVAITNPAPASIFVGPTNILIEADVFNDSSVVKVEFFEGGLKIGEDLSGPHYGFTWSNVVAGNYSLYARAVNDFGAEGFSPAVNITVRQGPSIHIISPAAGTAVPAIANVTLTSVAEDVDGYVTKVEYFTNGVKLGEFGASPYPLRWTNLFGAAAPGTQYTLTAKAFDNHGLWATSSIVLVTVTNQPPTVAITRPLPNATNAAGEAILLQATAQDLDGQVAKVQFFWGTNVTSITNLLVDDTNAPYAFTWTNAPSGSLILQARAFDNSGLSGVSALITNHVESCQGASGISGFSLSANQIVVGNSITATVTLNGPAVTGGQAITLINTNSALLIPPGVWVPEGQTGVTFSIRVGVVEKTNWTTIAASYHGQAPTNAALTIVPRLGIMSPPRFCGPMDVAVVIDSSGSMTPAFLNIRNDLTNLLNRIEQASGNDYRLALVAFASQVYVRVNFAATNRAAFESDFPNITGIVDTGGEEPEASDEALNTIINNLTSRYGQEGDFTNAFRSDAKKVILLITDDLPAGFDDKYTNGVDDVKAFQLAVQAGNSNIQISAILVPSGEEGCPAFCSDPGWSQWRPEISALMQNYALITGGAYVEAAADGSGTSATLERIVSHCGNSIGRAVFVRDDNTPTYSPITTLSPQRGTMSQENAVFSAEGIWGTVVGARMQRAGTLRHETGSLFDTELGIASSLGTASSFGLLLTNAQQAPNPLDYSFQWDLPPAFDAEIQTALGDRFRLNLTNRVSSICGTSYSITDTPHEDWPVMKNVLTFAVMTDLNIPQGRCRDFYLEDTNSPINGDWDVLFRGKVIASSGQTNGWYVEQDYTTYGGFNITVPPSAQPDGGYEVRVKQASWATARSTLFGVTPAETMRSTAVLLPLVVSQSNITSSSTVALTVALDAPAPPGGAFVSLTTEDLVNTNVPAYIFIPSGQRTNTMTFTQSAATGGTVKLMASYNGFRRTEINVLTGSGSAPSTPTGLQATNSGSYVLLTWNANTNATGYLVLKYNATSGIYETNFYGLGTNRFLDIDVRPGLTNSYKVRAFNKWGQSGDAGAASVVVQYQSPAPAPLILPFGGVFNDSVKVTLTNFFTGSTIFYTTNGSLPVTNSPSFTNGGVLTFSTNTTIYARTRNSSFTSDSSIASASFVIKTPLPMACNSSITNSLSRSNAYSTVRGPRYYGSRYRFDATKGDLVTISASSAGFDPVLYLIANGTNLLASNDDFSTNGTDSRIVFNVRETGPLVAEVTSLWGDEFGAFTLALLCQPVAELNVLTNAYPTISSNSAFLPNYGFIDFGTTNASNVVTRYLTITNSGNTTLTLSGINIVPPQNANDGFSVTNSSLTIPVNGITNLSINFYSTNGGDFGSYLTFTSNDATNESGLPENPFYVNLTGQIKPPSAPPLVSIYFPTNNTVITSVPPSLPIAVMASDSDGIKQVEFFTNGFSLGSSAILTNPPYVFTWVTNLTNGNYSLTARATDNSSIVTTSSAVLLTVGVPTLTLAPATNVCAKMTNWAVTLWVTNKSASGAPLVGSNVTFIISGANYCVTNKITDSNGVATFTYTGTNYGTDRVIVTNLVTGLAIVSNEGIFDWAKPLACSEYVQAALSTNDGFYYGCNCGPSSHYTDFYSFTATSGTTKLLRMSSTAFATYMVVTDTNCQALATNIFLNATDSQLIFSAPSNGTYIVQATSLDIFQTGSYSIQLMCGLPGDTPDVGALFNGTNLANNATLNFGTTSVGTPVTNTIAITNRGTTELVVSIPYLDSPHFTILSYPSGSISPNASSNLSLRFEASTSGFHTGSLTLTNSDPESNPFVLQLMGIANPSGTAPSVSLIAPTNNSTFVVPSVVALTAAATATGPATITNLSFFANGAFIGRTTNGINGTNYTVAWNNPAAGSYTLIVLATDSSNRSTISAPISVRLLPDSQNRTPFAASDTFLVAANSRNNDFAVLKNDSDPDGDALQITSITLSTNGSTAVIINSGTMIRYTPPRFQAGGDGFRYTISDGRGGSASAAVNLTIDATAMPIIVVTAPTNGQVLLAGTNFNITTSITPTQNLTKVEFFLGKLKIGELTNAPWTTFAWPVTAEYCDCGLQVRAFDKYGQVGVSVPVFFDVTLPADPWLPVARLDNPAPVPYQLHGETRVKPLVVREGFLAVTGAVHRVQTIGGSSTTNNADYKVLITKPDGTIIRESGWFTSAQASAQPLYTNDLTTVRNGVYDLQLLVRSVHAITNAVVRFILESDLKVGQFAFSEQDMVIPVNGMPLTVVRTYDSLNPNAGDFGHSWTYAINDLELELDEDRITKPPLFDDEATTDSGKFTLRVGGGRDVTLTLPNGRRTTFYYYEEAGGCGEDEEDSLCAFPRYQAAPGVNAKLRAVDQYGSDLEGYDVFTGSWRSGGGANTANENFDFPGFILTIQDGTEFHIQREPTGDFEFLGGSEEGEEGDTFSGRFYAETYGKARLVRIKQRTGDTIRINGDAVVDGKKRFSIEHYNATNGLTRTVFFERDRQGRISAIRDPLSGSNGTAVVKYEYDAMGNLSKVLKLVDRTNQSYLTNNYFYENAQFPHYLTRVEDARGRPAARQLYDDQGRLFAIVDASGRTNRFDHNVAGRTETVYDREGNQTIHVYDNHGNVISTTDALGHTVQRVYDTNNYVIRETDPLNNSTSYAHDENGNRTAVTNALGEVTMFTYDSFSRVLTTLDPLGHGTTNTYDPQGNLISTVDALGNSTTLLYDSLGRLVSQRDAFGTTTTNRYDSLGNLTNVVVAGSGGASNFTSYAFDVNGNRTNEVSVRTLPGGAKQSATNSFLYDGQNRVVTTLDRAGSSRRTIYNEIGLVAATANGLNVTNLVLYDERGLSVSNIVAWGLPEQAVETTTYDGNARRIFTTDPLGRVTRFVYDAANRQVQTIYPDGGTNTTVYDDAGRVRQTVDALGGTTQFGFDAVGRRVAVTNALGQTSYSIYDPAGNLILAADAGGRFVEFENDALNRRVRTLFMSAVIGQSRPVQTVGYDSLGRAVAQTNEAGVVTRMGYDALGRMTAVTNAWGTGDATWATYAYDEWGNQTNQVDALGRRTSFEFDALGRRVRRVLPNGQWEGFAFDVVGNLLRHTNFNGQVITNLYDAQNRLLSRWHGSTNLESHTYNAAGQQTARTDASGGFSWVYDLRGRVRTNSTPVGTLYYDYDVNGNLTSLQSSTAGGVSIAYQYDLLNRLTNVIDQGLSGTKNTAYRFDGVGNLAALQYPNGVRGEWQYDARNRLTNQAWKGNASTLASFSYQLGAAGNRTNLSDLVNGANRTFNWGYDQLYRLTNETISGASPTGTISYRLDAVGNRTNRTSGVAGILTTNNYFDANDWLDADNTTNNGSAWFDANGNTRTNLGGTVTTLLYDWANRLTNANNGAVVITYDGDGNRVKKVAGSITTLYLVSTINPSGYAQVVEELTVIGSFTNLARIYTYGLDLISQRQDSTVYFFGTDGLGSTRLLTDLGGWIGNTFAYDSFGSLISSTGPPQTPYLFAGEQFDFDLGFYFNRARYLDQNTGRFLSSDTFEGNNSDPLSLHKYLYAAGNPVMNTDPSGNDFISQIVSIGDMLGSLASFANNAQLMYKQAMSVAYRQRAFNLLTTVIQPTLNAIQSESGTKVAGEDAEYMLLGTAIVESGDLNTRRQIGGGPALGLYQMEPFTHNDLWNNYLQFRPKLRDAVLKHFKLAQMPDAQLLESNDSYATIMARIRYLPAPAAIPPANDRKGQAQYWVQWYNRGGKGTVADYLSRWHNAMGL